MTALRECLRKAVAAVNGPLLTDKSNEQAGWAAVSFLQSHADELLSILDAEGDGGVVNFCDVCNEPLGDNCACQNEYAREHDSRSER